MRVRLPAVLLFLLMISSVYSAAKTLTGVEYARPEGQSLLLDAQIPEGAGPFPAAIVVHGGAWVTGDRRQSVQPIFAPLSRAGIAWFSISYRLANVADADSALNAMASVAAVSRAVDDVRSAIAWVREHAAEYNIDPERIALVGESAGAQLASMAALRPGAVAPVQGVVAFYNPSDLGAILLNSPRIPQSVRDRLRGTPFEAMVTGVLRELSPINWVRSDEPPFLLIHGTSDSLVPFRQSVDLCNAMRTAGAKCDLYPVEDGGHGMRWWESTARQTSYKAEMIRWLRDRFGMV
jgi:acetyl esterase